MRKVAKMLAVVAALIVFGFGQAAAAEQYRIFRGGEIISIVRYDQSAVGQIDHVKKTMKVNGKEVLLPADATMVEIVGSGVMHLTTTELSVRALDPRQKADGDFFIHGYSKPLSMDDVIAIKGNMLKPRQSDLIYDNGGNEKGLFEYSTANDVLVMSGTKVEITVSTMREANGVRRVETVKKTIDF